MRLANQKLKLRFILFSLFAISVFVITSKININSQESDSIAESSEVEIEEVAEEILIPVEEEYPHEVSRNIPLYTYLKNLNVPSLDIIEMVKAAKPINNLSNLRPKTRFKVLQDEENSLVEMGFRFSAVEKMSVKKKENKWFAERITEKVDIRPVSYVGFVESTLWESALNAKMSPYLIVSMAEIFGWEVDFNREVRSGDSWRITAEQKFVRGEPVGWGSVLAAEYINQGVKYSAFLFRNEGKDVGYYNLEGKSLRKMFLKSPLRFGRVTSRFNRRRFHPKLRIIRPHYGVDYGAPIGTPVRSVADGVVRFARRAGGGGKVLKIRHNSSYKTAYKHLSRYAKGIRRGVSVKQGQIVAYVGNTGLSTGPHLHYEFYKNGRFVDPLKQSFPSAEPLASEFKSMFKEQALKLASSFPKWNPTNYENQAEDLNRLPASDSFSHSSSSWAKNLLPNPDQKYFIPLDSNLKLEEYSN